MSCIMFSILNQYLRDLVEARTVVRAPITANKRHLKKTALRHFNSNLLPPSGDNNMWHSQTFLHEPMHVHKYAIMNHDTLRMSGYERVNYSMQCKILHLFKSVQGCNKTFCERSALY